MPSNNLQKCRELKRQLSQNDDVVETARLEFDRFFNARISGQTLTSEIPSLETLAVLHF